MLLCGLPLHAQAERGTISGTVTDAAGTAVPGSQVTVTHAATNATPATIPITAA